MNASKENCRKALTAVRALSGRGQDADFVREFLEAAVKRLPSEAAFAKDKTRKSPTQKSESNPVPVGQAIIVDWLPPKGAKLLWNEPKLGQFVRAWKQGREFVVQVWKGQVPHFERPVIDRLYPSALGLDGAIKQAQAEYQLQKTNKKAKT